MQFSDDGGRITEPEDREDREDEQPVVVVLNDGDLSAAEVDKEKKAQEEAPPPPGTKIMFKKPTKRQNKEGQKDEDTKDRHRKKAKKTETKQLLTMKKMKIPIERIIVLGLYCTQIRNENMN